MAKKNPLSSPVFMGRPFRMAVKGGMLRPFCKSVEVLPKIQKEGRFYTLHLCINKGRKTLSYTPVLYQCDLVALWRSAQVIERFRSISSEDMMYAYCAVYWASYNEASGITHANDAQCVTEVRKVIGDDEFVRIMQTPPPEDIIKAIVMGAGVKRSLSLTPLTYECKRGTILWRNTFAQVCVLHPETWEARRESLKEILYKYEPDLHNCAVEVLESFSRDINCVPMLEVVAGDIIFDAPYASITPHVLCAASAIVLGLRLHTQRKIDKGQNVSELGFQEAVHARLYERAVLWLKSRTERKDEERVFKELDFVLEQTVACSI